MKTRHPPRDLYDTVLEITTAIAQPDKRAENQVDSAAATEALVKLACLFESRQTEGKGDPFLTETLADLTADVDEAIRLYRLAIEQCSAFPDEPVHTKRQGLAGRLIESGSRGEAQRELAIATQEAFAAGDADAVKELNALAQQIAV